MPVAVHNVHIYVLKQAQSGSVPADQQMVACRRMQPAAAAALAATAN